MTPTSDQAGLTKTPVTPQGSTNQGAGLTASTSSDWVDTLKSSTQKSAKRTRSAAGLAFDRSQYESLPAEALISIIKGLQAENLALVRTVEKLAGTSPAPNTTTTTLKPKKSFTFQAAPPSLKDFPYLEKASKGSKAPTPSRTPLAPRQKLRKATPEAKKWALRVFSAPPTSTAATSSSGNVGPEQSVTPTGFTFVYLPSNKKTKHSELRDRLRLLGVNLNRVYSIQRPAKNVVSLLIHNGYQEGLNKTLESAGLSLIKDFNPTSANILGDPKLLDSLDETQRTDKAKALYYNRILKTATQLRDAKLGLIILNHFSKRASTDDHFVPPEIVAQYLQLRPQAKQQPRPSTTASFLKGFDASALFPSLKSSIPSVTSSTQPLFSHSSTTVADEMQE